MQAEQDTVAGTGAWIAAARARESARPDRLFDDPWADLLAGDEGRARLAASEGAGGENRFLPVRTRFFDDVLVEATGWATQVVLLGAGLDTRAYRLDLPPSLHVYELDLPGPLAAKEASLRSVGARPVCERHPVAVDLRTGWSGALRDAGFDPSAPTAWLAEGLLFYLDAASVEAMLTAAALSGSRALLALDTFGTGLLRLAGMQAWIEQRSRAGQPLPFCTDDPADLVRRNGWPRCDLTQPGQRAANYGRLPPIPEDWAGGADPTLRSYLVVAASPAASPRTGASSP